MAKEKDKKKKLKRLYDQLGRFNDQPFSRESKRYSNLMILTQKGKIEQRIQTLENTK